jgi:hypothetical protein
MPHVPVKRMRQWPLKVVLAIIVAHWLSGPVILAFADEPQPDPAGIATGDKTTTYDAGSNAFVVTERIRPLLTTPQTKRHSTTFRLKRPKSQWR